MKIKMRPKYYCDFCKKSGGSKYHIQKHEDHCTMNPSRKCGMCKAMDETPKPISELLTLLPDPEEFHSVKHHSDFEFSGIISGGWDEDVYEMPKEIADKILTDLRETTNNCPACIMAALRQKGIFLSLIAGFDFKKEVDRFWSEINQKAMRHEQIGYY